MRTVMVFGMLIVFVAAISCSREKKATKYLNGKYGEQQGKGGCPTCPTYDK